MKTQTKALTLAASAVLLVTASVAGTLAYLTDEDTAVNTFTVGQATITLDETKVDEYGIPIEGADRVDGNEYRLIPGQTYVKDPTVTITKGSEAVYVRMLVTISDIADLKALCGDDFLPQNYVNGTWDAETWQCVSTTDNGDDTMTYEFRYYDKTAETAVVDASGTTEDLVLDALFDSFTVPGEATNEQLEALEEMEITVVGHAIQATGFADAGAAWAAFTPKSAT